MLLARQQSSYRHKARCTEFDSNIVDYESTCEKLANFFHIPKKFENIEVTASQYANNVSNLSHAR